MEIIQRLKGVIGKLHFENEEISAHVKYMQDLPRFMDYDPLFNNGKKGAVAVASASAGLGDADYNLAFKSALAILDGSIQRKLESLEKEESVKSSVLQAHQASTSKTALTSPKALNGDAMDIDQQQTSAKSVTVGSSSPSVSSAKPAAVESPRKPVVVAASSSPSITSSAKPVVVAASSSSSSASSAKPVVVAASSSSSSASSAKPMVVAASSSSAAMIRNKIPESVVIPIPEVVVRPMDIFPISPNSISVVKQSSTHRNNDHKASPSSSAVLLHEKQQQVAAASDPSLGICINSKVKGNISLAETRQIEWSNADRFYLYLCLKHFPLFAVMQEATKVLTTKDWILAREEMEVVKVMELIERMKEEDIWSCRQKKKFQVPLRRKTHWDHMLDEAQWMSIDFAQERRWKLCVAFELAVSATRHIRKFFKGALRDTEGQVLSLFPNWQESEMISIDAMEVDGIDNGGGTGKVSDDNVNKNGGLLSRVGYVDSSGSSSRSGSVPATPMEIDENNFVIEVPSIDSMSGSLPIPENSFVYDGSVKYLISDDSESLFAPSKDTYYKDPSLTLYAHPIIKYHCNYGSTENQPVSYVSDIASKRLGFSSSRSGVSEEDLREAAAGDKENNNGFIRQLPRSRSSTLFNYGSSFGGPLNVEISIPADAMKARNVRTSDESAMMPAVVSTSLSNASPSVMSVSTSAIKEKEQSSSDGQDWSVEEDDLLLGVARDFQMNWQLISDYVNSCSHSFKARSQEDCRIRFAALESTDSPFISVVGGGFGGISSSSGTPTGGQSLSAAGSSSQQQQQQQLPSKTDIRVRKDPLMRSKLLKQEWKKRQTGHLHLFSSVKKIISKFRPVRPSNALKKVSFMAHPSHEAAVKKAGYNMSKALTPTELAMRKLQKARAMAEVQHSMLLRGGGSGGVGNNGVGPGPGSGAISVVVSGAGSAGAGAGGASQLQSPNSITRPVSSSTNQQTTGNLLTSRQTPLGGVVSSNNAAAAAASTNGNSAGPITSTINTSNAAISMIASRNMRSGASSSNSPAGSPKPNSMIASTTSSTTVVSNSSSSSSVRPAAPLHQMTHQHPIHHPMHHHHHHHHQPQMHPHSSSSSSSMIATATARSSGVGAANSNIPIPFPVGVRPMMNNSNSKASGSGNNNANSSNNGNSTNSSSNPGSTPTTTTTSAFVSTTVRPGRPPAAAAATLGKNSSSNLTIQQASAIQQTAKKKMKQQSNKD